MTTTEHLVVGGDAYAQFGRRYGHADTEVYQGRVVAISGTGVARVDFGAPRGVVSFIRRGAERASAGFFGGFLIDADTFARLRPVMRREQALKAIRHHAFTAARTDDLNALGEALEKALALVKRLQGDQPA